MQQMRLHEEPLFGAPGVCTVRGVGLPRFGFLAHQKGEASELLPQMVCLGIGNGRFKPQLKIMLVDNGRFLATDQAVITQKKTFVSENVELEQFMMVGSRRVSAEWLGENGR